MSTLNENIALVYSLVWGQCSKITRTKLESKNKYAETIREIHLLGIPGFIEEVSYLY